jgi:hypothetical protein
MGGGLKVVKGEGGRVSRYRHREEVEVEVDVAATRELCFFLHRWNDKMWGNTTPSSTQSGPMVTVIDHFGRIPRLGSD